MSIAPIHITQLSGYRDFKVLFEKVSVVMHPGELWHIAGPNGIGKTTLLRMLAGLYDDYEGSISSVLSTAVSGMQSFDDKPRGKQAKECFDFRQSQLYIGHKSGVKQRLSPRENLSWMLHLAGYKNDKQTIDRVLAKVGLYGFEDTLGFELSAGQQRRVALAQLLCTAAKLWILDEPFTAIDRDGVRLLEACLEKHASNGGLAIISSHQALSSSLKVKTLDLQRYKPVSSIRDSSDWGDS